MGDGDPTVQTMMLAQLTGLREDVKDLGDKMDSKNDAVGERITTENGTIHGRINRVSDQGTKNDAEVRTLRSRVNWLYLLVAGFFVSLGGVVFGLVSKG